MAWHVPEDDAITTVATARPVGGTTLVLGNGNNFGSDGAAKLVTIRRGTPPADTLVTVLEFTGRTGNTLTNVVAYADHADAAVLVGDVAFLGPVKRHITELQEAIDGIVSVGGIGTSGVVSVKDHGAVGDGVADDTAAIRLAISDAINFLPMATGTGSIRTVYFPAGDYKVTGTIKVNAGQVAFLGDNREACRVTQHTPNIPIFLWDNAALAPMHTIRFAHLQLGFAAAPTSSTTQQYAIQFRSSPDGTLADLSGYYYCAFEDLRIHNTYVGIGAWTSGGGMCPIWETAWVDLWFTATKHSAIALSETGQPSNGIERVSITNGSFVSDGPALVLPASNGLVISDLNVEDWDNQTLLIYGGTTATIRGVRLERSRFSGAFPVAFSLSDGVFSVDDVSIDLFLTHETSLLTWFSLGGTCRASLRSITFDWDDVGSTTALDSVLVLGPEATVGVDLAHIRYDGHVREYLGYDPRKWIRVTVDGLPPLVDVLPTASATYRGRSFTVRGAAGAADVTSTCVKDATDVYAWKSVVAPTLDESNLVHRTGTESIAGAKTFTSPVTATQVKAATNSILVEYLDGAMYIDAGTHYFRDAVGNILLSVVPPGNVAIAGTLTVGGVPVTPGGVHWTWVLGSGTPVTTGSDKTNWLTVNRAATIAQASIAAKTAPTGSSLIVDILFSTNGGASWTSIWTTTANRLTLAAGTKAATTTTFNTTALAAGALLRIDVIAIGSTVAGQDITVQLAT